MHTSAMFDRVAAQTQQTADVGRRLEMHAHEMTLRMTFASAKKEALRSVQLWVPGLASAP